MDPIYCPKCKALLAADVEYCPKCAAATNLDSRRKKEALLGTPPPAAPPRDKNQHAGLILFCVIAAGFALSITLQVRQSMDGQKALPAAKQAPAVASAPAPASAPVVPAYAPQEAPPARQGSEETRQRLEVVGNIIAESGGRMTVQMSTVRIYLPGAVSEYDAERVAKMAGDRIGIGYTVRVYDNAELQRAQYTAW